MPLVGNKPLLCKVVVVASISYPDWHNSVNRNDQHNSTKHNSIHILEELRKMVGHFSKLPLFWISMGQKYFGKNKNIMPNQCLLITSH